MELRADSKLALTMKWAQTQYDQKLGWIIDGKYANEEDVVELVSMAYKQYDLDTVKRAIDYYKKNWKPKISKEKSMSMNKKVIEFENALMNNEDISAFSFDDTQENAELYSLLGNLYDTKGEVLFANYLYQRSALLGYPEGEGKLGWSYFCGYGLTVDDLNDNDIDISIHMRSDDLALFWLRKAQDDGWEDASRIIDMVKEQMSEREKKKSRTLEEMIEAAVAGFGTEQIELAEAYEKGDEEKGIPVDYEEAVRWYDKALYGIRIPRESVCKIIADILENKIKDKKRALRYYRKAYLLDDMFMHKNEKEVLADKIKKLTKELFPDRDEKISALDYEFRRDDFSDAGLKELAEIMEYVQDSIYEDTKDENEKDMLLKRIPKARAIINAAFEGRAVAENALGVFYHRGILLPMNFERAEYWFRCAYTDGYETAYDNLHSLLLSKGDKDGLVNFVIIAARDGVESAKAECEKAEIDCMKIGPKEYDALKLYPEDSLIYHDATEEEIQLIEQFFATDDVRRKRNILYRLIPATTDEYVYAYLNGKPTEYGVIDKMMDTDNVQERLNIARQANIEVDIDVLDNVPYMPLDNLEKKQLVKWGTTSHKRSPYRRYDFSSKWNKLTEKEKTVRKVMDADHRLSFDLANYIVDKYVEKLNEIDAGRTKSETNARENTNFDDFWLSYGNDSIYVKRCAYAHLKLSHKEITDKSLRQESANWVLNHINMSINPIMNSLVSLAASITYDRLLDEYRDKVN